MSIDDYLDLYNYAGSLGDKQWQASLAASLSEKLAVPPASEEELALAALWERFDRINEELKTLFVGMRAGSVQADRLQEQVWALKTERIIISQRIRSRHVRV